MLEEYNGAHALKKTLEGCLKMSVGYYELSETSPTMPKPLMMKALHQITGTLVAKIPVQIKK